MDEKRIKEVFSDEAFVKALLGLESAEEAQAALKEKGLEFSTDELVALRDALLKMSAKAEANGGELSVEDLDEVAGGILPGAAVSLAGRICMPLLAAGGAAVISLFTRGRW